MKLKNKKTGKIINSKELLTDEFMVDLFSKDFNYFNSKLGKICNEWEYVDEPEVIYPSNDNELVIHFEDTNECQDFYNKLLAWKRLEDKGVKFKLDFVRNTIHFTYRIDDTLHSVVDEERIIFDDIKTIFGGEE